MQGSRFADEFDRYYAESLSGGVRIPDPNAVADQPVDRGATSVDLIDAALHLETIPDNDEDSINRNNSLDVGGARPPGSNRPSNAGVDNNSLYQKNLMTAGDRRYSNASSRASSRSRSSSSGSSQRGLSIPERVAVTREGLVEQIIEKWRAAMDEHPSGKIIITDDENNSRFHEMTSSSSSGSTSGTRPRANTFAGRSASRSPPQPAPHQPCNSDDPLVDPADRDCAIGDVDEPHARQRAYSTNASAAYSSGSGLDYSSSRRSSGGQIFHFDVERRPSVASRLLSFLGARPDPKRCEIAIRQLTPLEASSVPTSTDIKTMELLLIGQDGVGKKEIVRSLLTAATAPPCDSDRSRLASVDSEISWDEQTCIVARSYLEIDSDIVNFTARSATNEEDLDRCLAQSIPDFILAVYSVADAPSVASARSVLSYAAQRTPKRTALCMVANKADLSGVVANNAASNMGSSPSRGLSRELSGGSVTRSAGRAAAKSVGASWLETSAVISLNIRTLLAALLQHWIHTNATTIAEEQQNGKGSSRRSSINRSTSGSFRNASLKPSRHNSLLVKPDNSSQREDSLSRTKSEKNPRSRSPSGQKVPRPHSALINACHPLFSALCVSKANGAADDGDGKNSNSNDSGVHDSPTVPMRNGRNESAL